MTQVTINGNTYSDDGSSAKDMLNGGHRQWFFPLVSDVVVTAADVAADAAQAAIDAANAANGAAATRGTSTTSLTVAAGIQNLTTQSGKQFVSGNYVTISRASAPTTLMHGVVTAYNSSTGALTVDVTTIAGSGTFTDWTIALSGAKGNTGATGNGNVAYVAKTSAYTVVSTDAGKLIDCTSGTFTLAFQAAASLGANWATYIRNSGTGTITLDPNGAETIDGVATYTLRAGKTILVQCNGSTLRVVFVTGELVELPVLSAQAATLSGLSNLGAVYNSFNTAPTQFPRIVFGNSLFIGCSINSTANVYTTPDGVTWTARTMPAAAVWMLCTDGTSKFVGVSSASTATAKSTDGITWVSGGALPGVTKTTNGVRPAMAGGVAAVLANAASTLYRSSDNGVTWTTEALPATTGTVPVLSVGGLFWFWSSTTAAYTSATGLAGSWTLRTLPASLTGVMQDFDGSLILNGGTHVTTDGITWNAQPAAAQGCSRSINGIYFSMSNTFGSAFSVHNGAAVPRLIQANEYTGADTSIARNAGATLFLCGSSGNSACVRFEPAAGDTPKAIFLR